jgi:hypothetical protein
MPGIVLGEVCSCANPLLPFFYQEDGFLKDVLSLRWEVFEADSAVAMASGTVNTDPCTEGGQRIGVGYYFANLNPQSAGLSAGPYSLVWHYKVTLESEELEAVYGFEVLDPARFRVGRQFEAYVSSDLEALDEFDLHVRQRALWQASKAVERITGRFFFPRFLTLRHTVRPETQKIWIDQPIIGVNEVTIEETGVVTGTLDQYTLDNSYLRVYNRHLSGLLSPDDRDNPRIAFATVGIPGEVVNLAKFPRGELGAIIKGAFAYTDPDGSPFGMVPSALEEVVAALAYRKVQDPSGIDLVLQNPGAVKKAKTRDQEVQFDTSVSKNATLTGDSRLDEILAGFMRPAHVGVAG